MLWFYHWVLHVTGGDNGSGAYYLEWSGWVGAIEGLSGLGIFLGGLMWLRHHNCHEPRCIWLGHAKTEPDGSTFHWCHRHHPDHARNKRSISAETVKARRAVHLSHENLSHENHGKAK